MSDPSLQVFVGAVAASGSPPSLLVVTSRCLLQQPFDFRAWDERSRADLDAADATCAKRVVQEGAPNGDLGKELRDSEKGREGTDTDGHSDIPPSFIRARREISLYATIGQVPNVLYFPPRAFVSRPRSSTPP